MSDERPAGLCVCPKDGSGTCEAHVWVEPAGKCICTTEHYDTNCPVHPCTEDNCRRGHGGNPCPVAYPAGPFPASTRGTQTNKGISPRGLFSRGFWTGIDSAKADDLHAALADALKREESLPPPSTDAGALFTKGFRAAWGLLVNTSDGVYEAELTDALKKEGL